MKKEKNLYLDLLSVLASMSVIMLHLNGCFWNFNPTASYWRSANIIEGVAYFAVPVFFMITGATLIDYPERYSTKEYFKKRIRKTLIPFLFWSIVGIAFHVIYLKDWMMRDLSIRMVYENINNTSIIAGIYWFFPTLFSVYLFIPLLAYIDVNKRVSVFQYVVMTGIISCFISFVMRVLGWSVPSVKVIAASGYLMYVIIGYLIDKCTIDFKGRVTIYTLGILGVMTKVIGTYYSSIEVGKISEVYSGYDNMPAILYATGLFCFFKYITVRIFNNRSNSIVLGIKKLILYARNYTFSVYLLHWFIYRILTKEFPIDTYSLYYRLGAVVPIFIIVVIITILVRKIPILKYTLPQFSFVE